MNALPPVPAAARRDRAWVEIDCTALRRNVLALQALLPAGCQLMAVVKAEAYGHGAAAVAQELNRMGVEAFAVATADEGIALRTSKVRGLILVLGYTHPSRVEELRRYQLTQTVADAAHGAALEAAGQRLDVHIKVDTGMHRLGVPAADMETVAELFHMRHLQICGMYTHLCAADSPDSEDKDFTRRQLRSFYRLLRALDARGLAPGKIHLQSSAGLLHYPGLPCDYARAGIALYGAMGQCSGLTPVLSLKARVVLIREICAGETAGYARAFTAQRDTRIAVVSLGYADGYPRALSRGKGTALLRGRRASVIGDVCMDQLLLDVTDIPEAQLGDTAVFLGKDGEAEIAASELAESAGAIANELLSRLGSRLETVLV